MRPVTGPSPALVLALLEVLPSSLALAIGRSALHWTNQEWGKCMFTTHDAAKEHRYQRPVLRSVPAQRPALEWHRDSLYTVHWKVARHSAIPVGLMLGALWRCPCDTRHRQFPQVTVFMKWHTVSSSLVWKNPFFKTSPSKFDFLSLSSVLFLFISTHLGCHFLTASLRSHERLSFLGVEFENTEGKLKAFKSLFVIYIF